MRLFITIFEKHGLYFCFSSWRKYEKRKVIANEVHSFEIRISPTTTMFKVFRIIIRKQERLAIPQISNIPHKEEITERNHYL